MNQHHSVIVPEGARDKIDVLDLLIVFAKHKRLLFWLPLAAAVVAAAIAFWLPPVFRSTTTLMPPQQQQSGAAALLSQLGGAASMVAGAAGIKNPNDIYVGMLRSRTVADALITRFKLLDVYELPSMEKTRLLLEERSTISSNKEGMITIVVEDLDPRRSAQLASAYVEELEKLTKRLAVTSAAQRRLFYERQLERAKNKLGDIEAQLKTTIETRGVISVDAESRAVAEVIGRLRAQVSAKEIQLGSLQAFVTPSNVQYKRAQEELESLRAELSRLENGRTGSGIAAEGSQSKAGFESVKMLRDLKYHQMLFELLAKQYEMARLDEANDPSVIQVLDEAIVPERKFKPKRGLIIVVAGLTALVFAMALALAREGLLFSIRSGGEKWGRLRSYLWSTAPKSPS
ncbi:GNVR domain-containing protein [Massilia sp. ZL223]|uniref:GumC family protein n=1 Tax=Massilia sp. ZL223 TaxID=2824904 RepID=UPI001B835F56|nr:GNVR domain-containing protein [Massilia sp. ZL223]MBQ5963380.1 lipopolysaccharide biosynthesis protein [Massilia sp. ZL223]